MGRRRTRRRRGGAGARARVGRCLSLASNDLCESSPPTRGAATSSSRRWFGGRRARERRRAKPARRCWLAKAWLPSKKAPGAAAAAPEAVPGFRAFARDVIVRECCVRAVLRGDLDLRDAGAAGAARGDGVFTAGARAGGAFADAFQALRAAGARRRRRRRDPEGGVLDRADRAQGREGDGEAAQEMVERAGVVGEEEKRPCTGREREREARPRTRRDDFDPGIFSKTTTRSTRAPAERGRERRPTRGLDPRDVVFSPSCYSQGNRSDAATRASRGAPPRRG